VANGCFLTVASRLGFRMKGKPSDYCFAGGYVYDWFNAWINISSRECQCRVLWQWEGSLYWKWDERKLTEELRVGTQSDPECDRDRQGDG
jgi:hypothetical protein